MFLAINNSKFSKLLTNMISVYTPSGCEVKWCRVQNWRCFLQSGRLFFQIATLVRWIHRSRDFGGTADYHFHPFNPKVLPPSFLTLLSIQVNSSSLLSGSVARRVLLDLQSQLTSVQGFSPLWISLSLSFSSFLLFLLLISFIYISAVTQSSSLYSEIAF